MSRLAVVLYLLSLTFAFAQFLKKGKTPKEKSKIIKKLNGFYLLAAYFMVVVVIIFYDMSLYFAEIDQNNLLRYAYHYIENLTYLWMIILYYSISRSNEIMMAFSRDVYARLSPEKANSDLKYYERISLAVSSYLELIFLFALMFFTISMLEWGSFKSREFLTMWESLYFSGVTIVTLGYGDISPTTWFPQLMAVYEVLCGFSLIIVSFTVYISKSIELKEYLPPKRSTKAKLRALKRRKT